MSKEKKINNVSEEENYPNYIRVCLNTEINELTYSFRDKEYNNSTNCFLVGAKKIWEKLGKEDKDWQDILADIANLAVKCFNITTVMDVERIRSQLEIRWYDSTQGIWRDGGDKLISAITRRIIYKAKTTDVNEVIDKTKTIYDASVPRKRFNSKNVLVVKNGVVDFDIREKDGNFAVSPHLPDFWATNKLDIIHDPKADCPKFKKFLATTLSKDEYNTIIELLGYCLYRNYHINSIFFWIGNTGSGKSTLHIIIRKFLGGAKNCSGIDIHTLAYERFAPAELFGKFVNFSAERGSRRALLTGPIKKLTGNDSISVDQKHRGFLHFTNTAKLVVYCNLPPRMKKDDAILRRMVLTQFKKNFEGKHGRDQEELVAECTTPEELSGILNLALTGLKRLLKRGKFKQKYTKEQKWTVYSKKTVSITERLVNSIVITNKRKDYIVPREIYGAYELLAQQTGEMILRPKEFYSDLRTTFELIKKQPLPLGRARKDKRLKKSTRVWEGIALNPTWN